MVYEPYQISWVRVAKCRLVRAIIATSEEKGVQTLSNFYRLLTSLLQCGT